MIFVVLELVAVAVQFRPYHLSRHVILPQRAKLHRNRATCDLPQSSLVVHMLLVCSLMACLSTSHHKIART